MICRLIPIFLLAVSLGAATPRPFAAVGDPLYKEIASLKHLAKLYAFKPHQKELSALADATEATKREGFSLEKKRSKEAADRYVSNLRKLEKRHKHAGHLIRTIQLKAITENRTKRFRQIMASQHSVLKEDPLLRRQIARYERKLDERRRVEAAKRQTYYKSAAHLNGVWVSSSEKWIFSEKQLKIIAVSQGKTRSLKGVWSIRNGLLDFQIGTITNQHHQKPAHTRNTAVKRSYRLLAMGEDMIRVRAPDRSEITLSRKQ
ncbi:MAG: hypothetical protein R3302_00460 [Sulfurimonadaceae bacterium]|nr:hypothetical protein [Sulfurimonadaceae bacterium]